MNLLSDPIPALVRRIAVPASIGVFMGMTYSITDAYFAGTIATDALAAVSLFSPIFILLIGVAGGLGEGATVLIANAIGEGRSDAARTYCFQVVTLTALVSAILSAGGLLAAPAIFSFLGAQDDYLAAALDYANVLLAGAAFQLVHYGLNATLVAKGKTVVRTKALMFAAVANVVLNPWFIHGGLGVPALGLPGIAYATLATNSAAGFYLFLTAARTNLWQGVGWRVFVPQAKPCKEILVHGIPIAVDYVFVGGGLFLITWFAGQFGTASVAAYGAASRIEQFVLLPAMVGLPAATMVLGAQNHGAGRQQRVMEAWRVSLRYGAISMFCAGPLVYLSAEHLMMMLTDDAQVISVGKAYLRISAATLFAYVASFVTVGMLRGIKRPAYAMWIGIYRQLVGPMVLFPALAVAFDFGIVGIWWGIFLVNWSAAVVVVVYGYRTLRLASGARTTRPSSREYVGGEMRTRPPRK